MKTSAAALLITNASYKEGFLEVAYRFENKTDHDVWLCTKTDWKGIAFESVVFKQDKELLLKIKSFLVPKDVFLEEPIFARYQKIASGKAMDFNIKIELPVYSRSPLKSDKDNLFKANDIDSLKLELGYFDQKLEENSECCSKTKVSDELLINCFWAEKNNEKIIFAEIKMKNTKMEGFK